MACSLRRAASWVVLLASTQGLELDNTIEAESGFASVVVDGEALYLLPFHGASIGVVDARTWSYRRVAAPIASAQYRGGCLNRGVVHLAPYAAAAPALHWTPRDGDGNFTVGAALSDAAAAFVGCVADHKTGRVLFVPGAARSPVVVEEDTTVLASAADFDDDDDDHVSDAVSRRRYAGGVGRGDGLVYLVPYDARAVAVVDLAALRVARRVRASGSYSGAAFWGADTLVFSPSPRGHLGVLDLRDASWRLDVDLNFTASSVVVVADDLALLPSRGFVSAYSLTRNRVTTTLAISETLSMPYAGGALLSERRDLSSSASEKRECAVFAPAALTTLGRVSFCEEEEDDDDDGAEDSGARSFWFRAKRSWRAATRAPRHAAYAALLTLFVGVAVVCCFFARANNSARVVLGVIDLAAASVFVAELGVVRRYSLLALAAAGLAAAVAVSGSLLRRRDEEDLVAWALAAVGDALFFFSRRRAVPAQTRRPPLFS